ncbi:hypothetical protein EDI_056510 [Entamoeba dispar SAW760]|uniref:Uncharacterized protein n=1 Tax=Entamoeba dispar (strain ATCC PRA-260 / SAW760) TaxID=370354 RepID=B0EMG8_ENTDS|nr:uncharacterized protein EDI_056510 [Entamoeba dispar SAW760]EDR24274.1 hypothetical protein EDI_056510 [Entamoeba dispar SAW760]|eukprot:EDR24274.1 hypothetical protein EDI_056510 [Entamoeba dispar SAW760]
MNALFVIMVIMCVQAKTNETEALTGVKVVKDLTLPPALIKSKQLVVKRLEEKLKLTSAQAESMAERIMSSVDENSINPSIERAKVVAKKVKKAAKITKKYTKGTPCGDELVNLAKMYDNKIQIQQFDVNKLNSMINDAIKKITAKKKLKEVKCLLKKSGVKGSLNVKKPESKLNTPIKPTLAEQYPEIAKLIPETKSPIDFKVKVNAKQMLQNKLIDQI